MPSAPRLHWPAYSPEATLPKSGFPVCPDPQYSESFIEKAIFRLDRMLRHWQGIFEFCQDEDCLLRIAMTSAKKDVALPDGSQVYSGDPIIEIHWWNEHVARLIANRPPFARAKLLPALAEYSLALLARYMATTPEARNARFIHGDAVLPMRGQSPRFMARLQRLGFWVVRPTAGTLTRAHDFFEEYLVRALLWAFHRRKTRRRRTLKRVDLWASRSDLLTRYRSGHISIDSPHHENRLQEIGIGAVEHRSPR